MRAPRWVTVGAVAVLLAGVSAAFRAPAASPDRGVAVPASEARVAAYRGAGSCSAVACHGSAAPVAGSSVLRNEWATWATRDKHADAFQTLFSARSRAIARNLGGMVPAHRDDRCLACHTGPGSAAAPERVLQDGIGCESCHGPSSRWLSAHTEYTWRGYNATVKRDVFGMIPLDDLAARAGRCAACHVGSSGHDVNHDLIAAGHPRLSFEFAAFSDTMPRHWVDKAPNATADTPARAWAIGQVVSAKAALEVLHDRAERAKVEPEKWPEFSEYDCFACHHDLRDEGSARKLQVSGELPGSPSWGSWYFPMTAALARGDSAAPNGLDGRVRTLAADLNRSDPKPGRVADQASSAAEALGHWLAALRDERFDAPRVRGLVQATRGAGIPGRDHDPASWDLAAQRFLALVPLRQALAAQDPSSIDPPTERLLDLRDRYLRFRPGYDSPAGRGPIPAP